jgi:Domain of unknown function (DUF6398)
LILSFATNYGTCDPRRWSENRVDMFLTDWVPRKVAAPPDYLAKLPALLRAFISYVHGQVGIPVGRTSYVLAAVELLEPDYLDAVGNQERLQGPAALMALIDAARGGDGTFDPSSFIGQGLPEFGFPSVASGPYLQDHQVQQARQQELQIRSYDRVLRTIEDEVGGADALQRLNTVQLPDEPFNCDGLEPDIMPVVLELLDLTDRCCDQLFDVEFRTAVRRLLARAASGDPSVFRRKTQSNIGAAALIWAVGKANDAFTPKTYNVKIGDLAPHFGLKSPSASQRASSYITAAGFRGSDGLRSPDFLVAAHRRQLLDRYQRVSNNKTKAEKALRLLTK